MHSKVTPMVDNITVSMDNIKSALETFLRTMKKIPDSQEVRLTFSIIGNGVTVGEWETMKVVPVQLQLKEAIQVSKVG